MDQNNTNPVEDLGAGAPETPEDVAVLYTWANVHGAKYRDFSAARREFRAQQRHRQVEAQRQVELEAARAAEDAAAREMDEARKMEEAANSETERQSAERARREAEERASRDRQTAQKHTDTAEELRRAMEDARREMEDARQRAEEQAARYAEADARLRAEQGGRRNSVPGETDDPYYFAGHLDPSEFAPAKGIRGSQPSRVSSEKRITTTYLKSLQETVQNQRHSSGPRLARSASGYHIIASGPPPVDTPEDTRERNRPDERERLTGYMEQAADVDTDGYYDGKEDDSYAQRGFTSRGSANPAGLNTAKGGIYIPPRPSAEIRAYQPEEQSLEEPTPGNPHAVPESIARRRRRSVSVDTGARTARQPRYTDSSSRYPNHTVEMSAYAGPDGDDSGVRSVPGASDARHGERHDRPGPPPVEESTERPEWLVSDGDAGRTSEEEPVAAESTPTAQSAPVEGQRRATAREQRVAARRARAGDDVTRMIPIAEDPLSDPLPSRSAPRDSRGDRYAADKERARGNREPQAYREERTSWTASDQPVPREKTPSRRAISADRPNAPADRDQARRPLREEPLPEPVSREGNRAASMPAQVTRASANGASDTLQQSREKVAARWFALKGLMGNAADQHVEQPQPPRQREIKTPMLTVVSLSGGVGKTSLVATLGRVLSAEGEKVLLSDTTAHGLLPYYFGARELRPSVVRTFSPPPGSSDAPVYMVSYEAERMGTDEAAQAALMEEIERNARGTQRVIIDLNAGSAWLAKKVAHMGSNILVPIVPDMNSVLSIQAIERLFAGVMNADGRQVEPSFVLNQFDASLPLHLDVREVLRQQLGDRLLPVIVRRSPAVAEALAEGMTVMDYAPESPVTEDYMNLAAWVRKMAAPASTGFRSIRWSER